MESWKPIAGYEGLYEVSDHGRVRSLDHTRTFSNRWGGTNSATVKGRILKPQPQRTGYLHVGLCKDGVVKYERVHRLVATAFLDNPGGLPEVNHKDEDKANNGANNLEWCDRRYNNTFGSLRDRQKGAGNMHARLTDDAVLEIRNKLDNGASTSMVAREYGISTSHTSAIKYRKRWGWL